MKVNEDHIISIEAAENKSCIKIIDQRLLPHSLCWETLKTSEEVAIAIEDMHLRGAPLIGASAAFGLAFAAKEANEAADHRDYFYKRKARLEDTRPTAINLNWAVNRVSKKVLKHPTKEWFDVAWDEALKIVDEDIEQCKAIGNLGLEIIKEVFQRKGGTVNILTHCNAGWLACLDYGTATAPIYMAAEEGIPIHVWVDETRPRNQGSKLTAWELHAAGIPHTIIADNTGGHLMQHGKVDLVIVGSDRTTMNGDVANKIGTYLKALAAKDNEIPFYVALPKSTFDPSKEDGLKEIPIEERSEKEISHIEGLVDNEIKTVLVAPSGSPSLNYGFDITPARLISALITERGVCKAHKNDILRLFPEFKTEQQQTICH